MLLSGSDWLFDGGNSSSALPEIGSDGFVSAPWQTVAVPHVFQMRTNFTGMTQNWYRHNFIVPPEFSGRRLYLVFEGAATIADVYVNGKHLGQHRGAYTRFVFDATEVEAEMGVTRFWFLALGLKNSSKSSVLPDKKDAGTTPLVRYQGALLNLETDSKVTLTLPPK